MTGTNADPSSQALALFDTGDFARSREIALGALEASPREASLLRIAGKTSVELGLADAVGYLEQAVALEPDNADAWRELADALLYDGRVDGAAAAMGRAVELRPDDVGSLIELAHIEHATGKTEAAVAHLEEVLESNPTNLAALRGLVLMQRDAGNLSQALEAARRVVGIDGGDVVAAIDVAELCLALDQLEEAVEGFRRLRAIDDEPDHQVYAYHGMIEAELRRERWRPALDLAVDATRVDRFGRTTDILAYVVAQNFGAAGREAPARSEIDGALAASRAEHTRLHASVGI